MTSYSIAIQTFVYRFDKYFRPLLSELNKQVPGITKVVFINGQYEEAFDERYRREILRFVAEFPHVYPIVSPIVRGCAFMWNTCSNFTDTEVILNLNDDLTVCDGFISDYESMLAHAPRETFLVDGFSAVSIFRADLFDIGYFDERLLGFGEEDGDWTWRWICKRGREIRRFHTPRLINHSHPDPTDSKNMRKTTGKYSAFNREWIFSGKYELSPESADPKRPAHRGMFDAPARLRPGGETPEYYPAERWYRENRHRL